MKYLKTYNESWSYYNDKIREEITDILYELTDNNYQVGIYIEGTTGSDCSLPIREGDSISIWIGRGTERDRTSGLSFTWNDIKPVIDHLRSSLYDRYVVSSTKALFNGWEQEFDPEVSRQHFSTVTVTFKPYNK